MQSAVNVSVDSKQVVLAVKALQKYFKAKHAEGIKNASK